MKNNVMVNYPKATSSPVNVSYSISKQGNLKTITCAVANTEAVPAWLELRKFELIGIKSNETYDLLFEQRKYEKNLDTILFMDKVFEKIIASAN
ncbi:hypothetical protein [Sphingobacterium sp. SYP-B4668]|uniref:hypothetical protein n=1 Tax=Sphingobacterium sp. SYP-B4668 TaxID=2996035 RepID=UPI0022DDE163|nr:hypothetical protein [Sphingobacterium sp. SYP-B4668]